MKEQFNNLKKTLILAIVISVFSCSNNDEPVLSDTLSTSDLKSVLKLKDEKALVFKGPEVQYGEGKARSWIVVNKDGFPLEIGIELTSGALSNLSELTTGHEETMVLPLHYKAKELTPFEHIGLNYQPEGHGPVFWKEHFDFHFYTITNEERQAIPPYDALDQNIVNGYNLFPNMTKMPADYLKFPFQGGAYPKMGKHWVPANWATGYNPFTHVMILGSYNQKNNFIEPMITVDYILSGEEFSGPYSQPLTFEESGNNYPTKYNIYHDNLTGNIYISLSDFVTR
jgi:hypothetical protein